MQEAAKTILTTCKSMRKLAVPTSSYRLADWIEARVTQYEKLVWVHKAKIEEIHIYVHPSDFKEASRYSKQYDTEIIKVAQIVPSTYSIEFQTSDLVHDTLLAMVQGSLEISNKGLGMFQGMSGNKINTETAWVLWQQDGVEVEEAFKIAEKLG